MELAPDFDEFIGFLTVHGVEFVVVAALMPSTARLASPAVSTFSFGQPSTTRRVCSRRSRRSAFPSQT